MQSTSPLFKLNWIDVWKSFRGSLLTFSGFVLVQGMIALQTELQNCVAESVGCQFDFGAFSFALPAAVSLVGMLLDLIRRWLTDHSK